MSLHVVMTYFFKPRESHIIKIMSNLGLKPIIQFYRKTYILKN